MNEMNDATRKLQFEMALDQTKSMASHIKAYQKEIAPLIYNYFTELMASGFTEQQAIAIVQAHGMFPPQTGGGNS